MIWLVRAPYQDPPDSCEGCRFWSEKIARSGHGNNFVEALCLSTDSEHQNTYVYRGCGMYEAGKPIDIRA